MSASQSKIFGIGLSKTGTTSLARALEILGYKTRDYIGVSSYTPGDLSSIDLAEIDANDAFTDTPVPSFYRELDSHYPDSKFILTIRDTNGWLQSCKKQFTLKLSEKLNEASNQLFMDLYGSTIYDENKFREGYENFTSGVHRHFKDRPQDLLVMDIAADDGWEKLCPFLNMPVPDVPFPKANVTRIRWLDINAVISIARKAGDEMLHAAKIIAVNSSTEQDLKAKQYELAKSVFQRVRYFILGGTRGIHQRTLKHVTKTINEGLQQLNPNIPVISQLNNAAPCSERKNWNHFWLVDTLDSHTGLLTPKEDFTINIALIEDRKPVMGIVFVPTRNILYYSMTGKESFRAEANGTPEILESYLTRVRELAHDKTLENSPQPASTALSICLAIEKIPDTAKLLAGVMEWDVAAAHAVIKSTGATVINCNTNSELTYNNENFLIDSLTIK